MQLTRSEERQSVIMLPYSIFSFNNFDIINFDVCWNLIKISHRTAGSIMLVHMMGGGELTGSQEIYFDYMTLFYISITW